MNYRTECLEIKNICDKSDGNNMRLIDANALADRIWNEAECYEGTDGFVWVRRGEIGLLLDEAPVVDAVTVIRCRECLCYTPVDDNIGKCVFLTGKHQYVVPDGYCYLEELKEGVDNG